MRALVLTRRECAREKRTGTELADSSGGRQPDQPAADSSAAGKGGHTVVAAADGVEALEALDQRRLRSGADGRSNAADGWISGDGYCAASAKN